MSGRRPRWQRSSRWWFPIGVVAALVLVAVALGAGPSLLGLARPGATPSLPAQADAAAIAAIGGDAKRNPGGPCGDDFEFHDAQGQLHCTHGPDPLGDLSGATVAAPAAATSGEVPCLGDGVSGKRVQAIYAYAADRPDRYTTSVPLIRTAAANIEWVFTHSAAKTGGERHVRWVTDAACQLSVVKVALSTSGDDNFDNTISELKSRGYSRADRKYLTWVDGGPAALDNCGIGDRYWDQTPTQDNDSNGYYPEYARMDNNPDPACWDWGGHSIPAHELIHMLGAVGNGAPNTTGHGHCTDEWDTECYSDYPNYPAMRLVCSSDQEALLDCNNNDYFAVNPAPNSYLTQYWNTANSAFLTGPLVTPSPSVSPTPAALPPDTTITAKPASPTNATSASFSFSATVAGSTFECALDAAAYAACTSPKVYNPIAEGNHTFAVRARNAAGVDASPAQATVLVDRTAPVATAPVQSIVIGSTLPRVDVNTVTVPLKLTWSATDAGSGVASYVLRTSTNLGVTWTTISPASFTATTMTVQVRPGSTFTYQVMATDRAGNAGAFATGPNMLIAGYQQDHAALVYRGTTAWSNGSSTSYWSGADKYTTTANNSVTFTVSNVRTVAWISYRNTTMGKAAIYLDGSTTAAATVDLYATAAQFRYVIWSKTWATAGNHTIKVVVLGTAGRPRVDVDAFVALHDQ